jgi:hypothetical protein
MIRLATLALERGYEYCDKTLETITDSTSSFSDGLVITASSYNRQIMISVTEDAIAGFFGIFWTLGGVTCLA